MKNKWQSFSNFICNLAVYLAEFRKCLTEYIMHNLATLFGPTQGVV